MHFAKIHRPFLVFAILATLFLLAFAGWSAIVFWTDRVPELDREISKACSEHASSHPSMSWAMGTITKTGGIYANLILALGGALWMWRHHRRRFAIAWLAIALVGGLIDLGLKDAFGRQRPGLELRDPVATEKNASYPSGHAMGSLIGYSMVGFVIGQRIKGGRRIALVAGLAVWVGLIGLSRVYLRAHWFSDIVGGWLMGAAYMNACLAIYFWRNALASRAASFVSHPSTADQQPGRGSNAIPPR